MLGLKINLKGVFDVQKQPQQSYADLINDQDIKAYIELARELKHTIMQYQRYEFKLAEQQNIINKKLSNDLILKIEKLSDTIDTSEVCKAKKLAKFSEIQKGVANKLNKKIWKGFFYGLGLNYHLFPNIAHKIKKNTSFNKQSALKFLKQIDESIIEDTLY